MALVYVTQIPARRVNDAWVPTIDLTPAREWGDLNVLLPSGLNHPDMAQLRGLLRTSLAPYKPSDDFLLPLGDPAVQALACAILAARFGGFRMLRWDRRRERYFDFEIQA